MLRRDRLQDSFDRKERQKTRHQDADELATLADLDALLLECAEGDTDAPGVSSVAVAHHESTLVPVQPAAQAEQQTRHSARATDSGEVDQVMIDDMEGLVSACESSWRGESHPFACHERADPICGDHSSTLVAANGGVTATLPTDDPAPGDDFDTGDQYMRWTRDAFSAYRHLRKVRPLVQKLSKQVFGVSWESTPGNLGGKKFPFFIKEKKAFDFKKGCQALKEEWEIPHQVHPERKIFAPEPTKPDMPAWNKLPAAGARPPELREVVAGVRFASIAFRGQLSPHNWAHSLPGSDVLCMSIDLHDEAAARFLAGEDGDIGKSLKRRLLRRLDLRGEAGDVTAAAIWIRPSAPTNCAVRVFIMFQRDSIGAAVDVELEDRNLRFWQSLQKHQVEISPDGMPLWVPRDHLAPYLGLSKEELDGRWDEEDTNWWMVPDIQEYTPEDGFASDVELARRRARSHRKWARFTSRLGLPAWISPAFMKRIEDYFFFAPEHTRERDRLVALKKKYPFGSHKFTKTERLALTSARLMELSPGDICLFRCSPAQFAALAIRDGEVLGEYCDSAHKAGRAKDLYEAIRKEWVAPS